MRQDNSKILGFGLLALAAVLALKKPAAAIGLPRSIRATPARMRKITEVDKMLREYYDSKYKKTEKRKSKTTTSKYYKFKDGNVFVEIRNGNHATRSAPCNYLVSVNLYELTGNNRSSQEAFSLAKNFIDKTIKQFK